MKTKYVLLTAVSALMVATGANAKTEVATKAYTDIHLATKSISAPGDDEKGYVVTVGDDGNFKYTNKADALPTTNVENGDVLTWDGESWVAGEDADTQYDNGNGIGLDGTTFSVKAAEKGGITVTEDGVSVNVDGTTITKDATTGALKAAQATEMTGATSSANGAAGLVPAPAQGDQGKFLTGAGTWENETTYEEFDGTNVGLVPDATEAATGSFLSADGTWATPEQVEYSNGNGIAKSGNTFSVKAVTDGGITVTSDGVSVDKDAVLGGSSCASDKCALVANKAQDGTITYTWEDLTEPYEAEEPAGV
ncbi:MAG: hypothetical protein ACLRFI_00655 [Alphaproteobacteria bacterium]